MKPTVLVDCDGVLADFTSAALELVYEVTGRRYPPSDVTTWEVFDSIPEPLAQKEVYRRLKGQGGCLGIPVYPDAKEGIARLREFAHIIVVTSPFKGSETWAHERELWLEQYFGTDIDYVIHARRKERVHGDIFIDDKPEHIDSWLSYWVHSGREPDALALLWETDRTITEKVDARAERVKDWADVYELVQRRIRR